MLGVSSEDEMIACFLRGELASVRFGGAIDEAAKVRYMNYSYWVELSGGTAATMGGWAQ